jgi:hypothetical protein
MADRSNKRSAVDGTIDVQYAPPKRKARKVSVPANGQTSERKLSVVLAFAFGCVFVSVVLALAFKGGSPDDRQFEILRIVLALAGGGVSVVFPGFLDLKVGTK